MAWSDDLPYCKWLQNCRHCFGCWRQLWRGHAANKGVIHLACSNRVSGVTVSCSLQHNLIITRWMWFLVNSMSYSSCWNRKMSRLIPAHIFPFHSFFTCQWWSCISPWTGHWTWKSWSWQSGCWTGCLSGCLPGCWRSCCSLFLMSWWLGQWCRPFCSCGERRSWTMKRRRCLSGSCWSESWGNGSCWSWRIPQCCSSD